MIRKLTLVALAAVLALSVLSPAEAQRGRKQRKGKKAPTPAAEAAAEPSGAGSAPAAGPASPDVGRPSPEPDGVWREVEPEILAYAIAPARATLARAKDPAAAGTLVAEGRILTLEARYADAVARFDRAAAAAPEDPAPLVHKGEALLYARQEGPARQALSSAKARAQARVDQNPRDAEGWLHLGMAQRHLGEHDAAYAALERARALTPDDERVVYEMGATRYVQQRWQPAIDLLDQALGLNPRVAYAYYLRGMAASQANRKDLTVNDLGRFLEIAPNAPEAERARKILESVKR